MSKTKYVEFRDDGFWAFDVGLGIFLKYLVDVALPRATLADGAWIGAAIDNWRQVAVIPDIGLEIDSSWSPSQLATLIQLANETCGALATRETLTAEEITSWVLHENLSIIPRGYALYPTTPVIELGPAIVAFINGLLPEAPPGRQWVFGAPGGRTAI
jgi:hypothetical protein